MLARAAQPRRDEGEICRSETSATPSPVPCRVRLTHHSPTDTMSLQGKTLLITGASAGIGRATALLAAAEGAHLVLTARQAAPLQALAQTIHDRGGRAAVLAGDVGDEGHAHRLVELAVQRFGQLDAAFNNAGTLGALGPTPEVALEAWEATLRTNLTAAFLAAKAQIPALLAAGAGSLVFTGTFVGHTAGFPGLQLMPPARLGWWAWCRRWRPSSGRAACA